ncbi:hypothetical protein LUW76_39720 [Actinomadura madurae]|uniref:helix-turn-helix domain-containing protein n=1 Tax=Actinomadura madurae TaxID=1993 RepID=UPI002025E5E2|nr:hypothetical protein [Actinomadura madurae]URM99956.1 hypothetical protein LUW76_39720 [Actinomadura madurae]URN02124.1 hypothetical protein LUW74_01145 [Actinomadura madurae]
MEFAGALRQAVQASGLTLDRIRHRLGRQGLTVSVATLSYWQRGRSRPRSRTVVVALEEILQVPPGSLTELLDDPAAEAVAVRGARPGPAPGRAATGERGRTVRDLWSDPERYAGLVGQLDRSGDHRLERLSIHDVYRLDEARRCWTLSVRTVLRAAGDDVDRVVCVHQTGDRSRAEGEPGDGAARLGGLRYCRPGRVRAEGGLVAFELVFDRVLSAGDTAVVEYELGRVAQPPCDSYDRRFSHPVHDYVAIVQFAGDRLPARCYGFTAETSAAPRRRLGELWIGTSGSANIAVGAVRRGIVGIEWEWH